MCKRRQNKALHGVRGVITLEFLILFPLIIAMLYAAAIYGIVFFSQYRMQNAVEGAVNAGLYVDRSAYPCDNPNAPNCTSSALASAVQSRAQTVLSSLTSALPATISVAAKTCTAAVANEMLSCSLSLTAGQVRSIVPVMSFGFLGTFPPLPPNGLKVDAHAAF